MGSKGLSTRNWRLLRLLPLLVLGIAAIPRPAWCGSNTADNGRLRLDAEPCFTRQTGPGVLPIAVTLTNQENTPVTGDLTAYDQYDYDGARATHQQVTVPAGGVPTHFIVYSDAAMQNSTTVEFASRRGDLTYPVPITPWFARGGRAAISMITGRVGVLSPIVPARGIEAAPLEYTDNYVTPANAPNRPIGYHASNAIVVSCDSAALLNPDQITALRRWVIKGGSLIVLGATHDAQGLTETLDVPRVLSDDFRNLLPVALPTPMQSATARNPAEVTIPLSSVTEAITTNTAYNFPGVNTTVITGRLLPDAASVNNEDKSGQTWLARRSLGAGTVVYCGVDLTDRVFRAQGHYLNRLWSGLIGIATPYCASRSLAVDPQNAPWAVPAATGGAMNSYDASQDAFHVALPRLQEVLYVFLAYFVLAIPVTFVVLKRMRRLNLAWVTGPILAVFFAGVFCLFSIRLYSSPLARRTSGVLTAANGDHEAQFAGYTEFFFPHGGSYDVTIPHADHISTMGTGDDFTPSFQSESLETFDDGTAISAPNLAVGNLSFRRVFHSQTVDLGGGIVADLRYVPGDMQRAGRMSGTITNNTGLTLTNVTLKQTGENSDTVYWSTTLPTLKPGVNNVLAAADVSWSVETMHSPVLVADLPGDAFGPQLGKSVGGDSSVKLVVSLPRPTVVKE